MKLLFWALLGLFVWWVWRRAQDRPPSPPPPPTPAPVSPMVCCAHCGLHLPREDAVAGERGSYCSVAHRQAAGDHNPG